MKTSLALIVAVAMGVVGAALNWFYLNEKSREMEKVPFLAIKPGITIHRGEVFREDHFVKVELPGRDQGEYLMKYLKPYESLGSLVGMRATREYGGSSGVGEFVLQQDLKTPSDDIEQSPDELILWIPVDTRLFVARDINPGDKVSFLVPDSAGIAPPQRPVPAFDPDNPNASETPPPVATPSKLRRIGKFKVVSVGNRHSTYKTFKGYGDSQQQENVLGIAVKKGSENERAAETVLEKIQQSSLRQAGVVKHHPDEKEN